MMYMISIFIFFIHFFPIYYGIGNLEFFKMKKNLELEILSYLLKFIYVFITLKESFFASLLQVPLALRKKKKNQHIEI